MDARDAIKVGMSAERRLVVPRERTVGHFVPHMPMVYATPMMILEMEMTSGDAINKYLEPGWVTVGTEVDIRHLAATPVGATVRTTARVIAVERRVIRFEVEAFNGERRIGEGRHARGLVNVEAFNKRFGAGQKHSPPSSCGASLFGEPRRMMISHVAHPSRRARARTSG
jgi:fluoroacetyl-CoA thioesterase